MIDGQTAETVQPLAEEPAVAAAAAPLQPIESPFSHVNVHRAIGETCVDQCRNWHHTACSATRVGHQVGHHTRDVQGGAGQQRRIDCPFVIRKTLDSDGVVTRFISA